MRLGGREVLVTAEVFWVARPLSGDLSSLAGLGWQLGLGLGLGLRLGLGLGSDLSSLAGLGSQAATDPPPRWWAILCRSLTGLVTNTLMAGNGGVQVLSDVTAAGAQRFYRVRRW
jgi:hypothetical protein